MKRDGEMILFEILCTSGLLNALKGIVSQDFFALVFFLNLFILVLLEMP